MATTCPNCGAAVGSEDRFCPACGAAVAAERGAPSVGDLAEPRNLARIAQVVALIGFVLPWITVSCQGRVLAQVSGLDMALGRATVHNPFTGVSQAHSGSPNGAIVVALVMIIAGLAISFNMAIVRTALANIIACATALLLIAYEVLVSAGSMVRSQASTTRVPDNGVERSIAEAIKVGTGFGFWLTCLALAAAIFFYLRVRGGGRSDRAPHVTRAEPQVRSNGAGSDPPPP
ncbi:MAG TPA: zinc ribbon domain-containing protein [Allosphingosinicella sp.]|jgi:hypothetical protein